MDYFTLFLTTATIAWFWFQLSFLSFVSNLLIFITSLLLTLFVADVTAYSFNTRFMYSFIWKEKVSRNSFDQKTKNVDDQITRKLRDITGHLIHDFILSWYNTVTTDVTFVQQAFEIFEFIFQKIRLKIEKIDSNEAAKQTLHLLHTHIFIFKQSLQAASNTKDPKIEVHANYMKEFKHHALSSEAAEIDHLRKTVKLLLTTLLPEDYHISGTSEYLVRELIAQNVLQNFIDMISEPSWIYQAIIEVFGEEDEFTMMMTDEEVEAESQKSNEENTDAIAPTESASDEVDEVQLSTRPPAIGQEDAIKIPEELPLPMSSEIDHFSSKDDQGEKEITSNSIIKPKTFSESEASDRQTELPGLLFYKIEIPDTMSISESFNHKVKYTLYRITYTIAGNNTKFEVCRRFREFMTLQERLQSNHVLRSLTDNVQGPSRMFPVPFGNMDKEYIEQRRKFLQEYLRHLASIPLVNKSYDVKEFLAYNRDPSIAFVQRQSSLPRLDKILKSAVTDLFTSSSRNISRIQSQQDISKVPTPELDRHNSTVVKIKNIMMRNTARTLSDEEWDLNIDFIPFQGPQNSSVIPSDWTNCEHIGELRDQNQDQTLPHALLRTSGDGCDNVEKVSMTKSNHNNKGNKQFASLDLCYGTETVFCLIKTLWDIDNGDNCILTMTLSKLLQEYIQQQINNLTTFESWCKYLDILNRQMFEKSTKETAKYSALYSTAHKVLSKTFPDLLSSYVGDEVYESGVTLILDSFSHKVIVKQCMYHIFDILIGQLFIDKKS